MTPLEVLVTSMAYLMGGDGDISAEERAKLLGVIQKHVNMKEMQPAHLKTLVTSAFAYAEVINLDIFLAEVTPEMSPGQRLSIYANLYDVSLADGVLLSGENNMLERFQGMFELDSNQVTAIKEVLRLKNDTTMFTNLGHPANDPRYKFRVHYQRE
ncbi:MAG: TerB family tellurite resistance protein [Rhodospirillaceae bacterium]|nr:TerB family tellurite resistance protein [Rhodospirillaceae bacterium]MBT5513055.1 TerB family tellurite resistance protein [Rhodospirillaceae bacterium]MBT6607743.1 TerB family tellurite resistance protein [Rhodospirillaceae bacterium]MBT7249893.1 TerB family tellurite resistance protein [Rhodospirillaceae bacterium]